MEAHTSYGTTDSTRFLIENRNDLVDKEASLKQEYCFNCLFFFVGTLSFKIDISEW